MLERIIIWWRGRKTEHERRAPSEADLPKCEVMIRAASDSADSQIHEFVPRESGTDDRDRLLEYLAMVGITERDFVEMRDQARNDSTQQMSDKALAWKLLTDLLSDERTQQDYRLIRAVFHAMAWFKFGHGEDCREEVERREQMNLLDLRRKGFRRVRIHPHCRCTHCAEVNRREITIDQALEQKPLPVRNCDRGRAVLCHYRGICEPGAS